MKSFRPNVESKRAFIVKNRLAYIKEKNENFDYLENLTIHENSYVISKVGKKRHAQMRNLRLKILRCGKCEKYFWIDRKRYSKYYVALRRSGIKMLCWSCKGKYKKKSEKMKAMNEICQFLITKKQEKVDYVIHKKTGMKKMFSPIYIPDNFV